MNNPIKEDFFEELLTTKYKIPEDQMAQARKLAAKNQSDILLTLQQLGALTEQRVIEIQVECLGTRLLSLKNYPLKAEVVQLLPEEIRSRYQLLPVHLAGNILTVATSSVFQGQQAFAEIQKVTTHFINFVLAYPAELRARLLEFSKAQENIDEMLEIRAKELTTGDLTEEKLLENAQGPIAQVISLLVNQAVTQNSSDMHFEPLASVYRVRFRQDGILREIRKFEKVFTAPFAAAIKIIASMDIAETRLPQDGTFRMNIAGRTVDFRVATFPTEFGEKIVIRILDSNKGGISLDHLYLPETEKKKLIEMIEKPYGLIVCAGPTGSGKSTSLYAILNHLNTDDVNILTIEDPIEYRMAGVSQAQVNIKKGFTFASGLRAMMRLDPNVILVGEMRDLETAAIGCQAALTGHLVLSTVHANSAAQTVSRFIDLGVEDFTVAAALQGVISQRLVRRICEPCKEPFKPQKKELVEAGFSETSLPDTLYRGKGCKTCHGEGYKGRIPILELMVVHDEMRNIIQKGANPIQLLEEAKRQGLLSIRENALEKVRKGLTSVEEVLRVLGIATAAESSLKKAA